MARIAIGLCVLTCLVAWSSANIFREKRHAHVISDSIDCSRPPRITSNCCEIPRTRIWGDLRDSFQLCFKTMKQERMRRRNQRLEDFSTTEPEKEDAEPTSGEEPPTTPAENIPPPPPPPPPGEDFPPPGRDGRKHHFRHHKNNGCLMECVFKEENMLTNDVVDKAKLIERLQITLINEPNWLEVALDAVETCSNEIEIQANRTCISGSDEMFRCVFKKMFLNCPTWNETSDDCAQTKETVTSFYNLCPNGPPPKMVDHHGRHGPGRHWGGHREGDENGNYRGGRWHHDNSHDHYHHSHD